MSNRMWIVEGRKSTCVKKWCLDYEHKDNKGHLTAGEHGSAGTRTLRNTNQYTTYIVHILLKHSQPSLPGLSV